MTREVAELTGRKVVAFMSGSHQNPDLLVEIFVLEPLESISEIAHPGTPEHAPAG